MRRISNFSYFLRTGRSRPVDRGTEVKFNPWHDPDDGRFTFVGQGRYFAGGQTRTSSSGTARTPAQSRTSATPKPIGPAFPKQSSPKATTLVRSSQSNISRQPGPDQDSATTLTNITAAIERTRREMGGAKPDAPKWRSGGHMSRQEVGQRATNAMRMYRIHLALGMRPEEAAGWAANAEAESRGDYRAVQRPGPGRGLFQWGSEKEKFDRRRDFQKLFGHSIERSTEAEQLAFRDWERTNTEMGAAKKIAKTKSAADIAIAIAIHYERPDDKEKRAIDRANIAEEIIRKSRKQK